MPFDSQQGQEAPFAHVAESVSLTPQDILGPVLADLPAPGRTRHAPALARCLSRWSSCLQIVKLESAGTPLLAVWLPAEVEAEVERTLIEEPALGLLLHRLAARLVMTALAGLRPDLAERHCAPLPAIDRALARSLSLQGLTADAGHLARSYAVLTYDTRGTFPASRTGCEGCSLRAGCPGPRDGNEP